MEQPPAITEQTVVALIREQFPHLGGLPVRRVPSDGWDNRSFRLGDELVARLPSAAGYVPQVAKEIEWLPWLAERLSIPIPEIVAVGVPCGDYPFPWTLRRWIRGAPYSAPLLPKDELHAFLATFLAELWSVEPAGPAPGAHSAHRGAPVRQWDDEVEAALSTLPSRAESSRAAAVWRDAVTAEEAEPPVPRWFHGDIAPGNLLVDGGRVVAAIDFGCAGVGDPACDLAICWTDLDTPSRESLRTELAIPDPLWHRGQGWALWKALITLHDPGRRSAAAATLAALGVLD